MSGAVASACHLELRGNGTRDNMSQLVAFGCALLYAVPRTAVIGAVLLTGYLGGAVATHVRVGDAFLIPVVIGVLVWAGLNLRDERLRKLLPLRSSTIEDEGKLAAGLEV